jgi:hypothetical protein
MYVKYQDFSPAELDDHSVAALKSFETELSSKSHQNIVLIAYSANANDHEQKTGGMNN